MPTGIIIVDKPADWTSQDVAARLRGVFHERRVGHGGTLDPMATGVLPIFVGRATRAVPFFEHADKEYVCALRPGVVTDTQDITGAVLRQESVSVSGAALLAVLPRFLGEQDQLPPMYSAVKVGGKKLYELARRGREVPRTPRRIQIRELEFLGRTDDGDFRLRVWCSKGTYIRTLCADIGDALGCGGCMSELRRTRAGAYTLADAVPLSRITDAGEGAAALLRPVDSLFEAYPAIALLSDQEALCRNGTQIPMPQLTDGLYRVYGPDGAFLMLGRAASGRLLTEKSFFEVT